MINKKDALWFESSRTYWTLFCLCVLVPLPARAEITCASCFAPIRRNEEALVEAKVKPSSDFGSVPDDSTDKNWIQALDGAQLSSKAHRKSSSVSWREKLENAPKSSAEQTGEKGGKVYPTWSSEEIKVNRREKRSMFPPDHSPGSRFEFRRTGGVDGIGKSPRQNEPHLITSTFALSGDSAHNQAMVLWSGHNSSVSVNFIQCVLLYDSTVTAIINMWEVQMEFHLLFCVVMVLIFWSSSQRGLVREHAAANPPGARASPF